MAATMLMLINSNIAHTAIVKIYIIAAISWLPPLISQLFHPGFLRLHHFFTAWLFSCGFHFFLYFIRPQNQPMADFEVCFYPHFFFSM